MINANQYYSSNNSSTMIFSDDNYGDAYPFTTSYSSPSVDCTLSLGTPSTRLSTGETDQKKRYSCMSNFGWNILHSKPPPSSAGKHLAGSNSTTGGDPLLARRCASCDTTSTPLWRNGPRGPKSLCNACGIRFKKEERRATATATATATANNGGAQNDNSSWVHQHHSQNQKIPCYSSSNYANEFNFTHENDHHHNEYSDHNGVPFLTWRFNVTDRPSFVHDFTR